MLSAHTISRDAPSLGNEPRDLSGIKTGLILLVLGISSKPSMSTARSTVRERHCRSHRCFIERDLFAC